MNLEAVSSELAPRGYELLSRAGSGGAAEVWKARASSGALVALKIEKAETSRPALVREARHAALALSPRLPELFDLGWLSREGMSVIVLDENDAPPMSREAFVALRWIEGESLRDAMHAERIDRELLALRVAVDVGEALSDLHEVALAHGDLKPENIVLDEHGRAHIIDLGLACPAYERSVQGATPRYLALSDGDLGDARTRDLAALGALIAEIVDARVEASASPIEAARQAKIAEPLQSLCNALLSQSPSARASAAWVAEMARSFLLTQQPRSAEEEHEHSEREARRVRAAYLAVRRDDLSASGEAQPHTAPWLSDALAWMRRERSLLLDVNSPQGTGTERTELRPLDTVGVARWLTLLVGSAVAAWPMDMLSGISEDALASALVALAKRVPPRAWTFADVEGATRGSGEQRRIEASPRAKALADDDVARIALAIAEVPSDAMALQQVEQASSAPVPLLLCAASSLRLRGELGRAKSLVMRALSLDETSAAAEAAEILRRAGELEEARSLASSAAAHGDGRARGILARIAFDARRMEEAAELTREASTVGQLEVEALLCASRGERARANQAIARAEVLTRREEERARIAALRGYVEHGGDPARVQQAYTRAVEHAAQAGAVVEEATYRTGQAAAAVDGGDLELALETARRAALLWEHLSKPALAARALLARAAAFATAGASTEVARAAKEAIARAREGNDSRAEAYALWAIADVSERGTEQGRAAAERARALLSDGNSDDSLRASARLLRHAPEQQTAEAVELADKLADAPSVALGARLDWWRARAEHLLSLPSASDVRDMERVVSALVSLADARAPVAARGPALYAGYSLAARAGRGDVAIRLLSSLRDVARDLLTRAPPALSASIRALPWVTQAATVPQDNLREEQARELQQLIVSLSDRSDLRSLLNRVVDALVLWTGVERGLLLLRAPNGRLAPRAARNLARSDLQDEQLALSQTLAHRALDALEPVVAVDATGELPAAAHSVHALKLRSVLVVPLIARGEALGVVYLDDRVRKGAFGSRELAWTQTIATIAAIAIADARDQVLLKRAARRAKRAKDALEETLARREAMLDVAERELNRARSARETRFRYDAIIGDSDPMRAMLRIVDRVTASSVPVLISGESGSGKELVARAIHANGPRGAGPFVSENCGAIPEGLLESTLFGHVRGAFTGADRPRSGLFEAADHGTLFLDEIGEMSLAMQAKLLRVLEDGLVRPLGTERARKVDVRIIAATHRDLEAMVRARSFREDLLYRLNIITIRIPPLRERASDVPLIVDFLLTKYARREVRVTRDAMDRLMAFSWPGNVRQLENEIRRALVLCDDHIDREHLSPEITSKAQPTTQNLGLLVKARVDALESELVREALERTRGNQTQAAKMLGLSRFGLQKMMKRLGITL